MHDAIEASGKRVGPEIESTPVVQNPRRVRHITAVQVRNLTPFPVRDAFASALKLPSEQSQFTPQGHFTDDLDVVVGRKHARRLSSSSSIHGSGTRHDQENVQRDGFERAGESGARRRTLSKASTSGGSTSGASAAPSIARRSSSGVVPTVRPPHRQRTISATSAFTSDSGRSRSMDWRDSYASSSRLPEFLQDTSQRGLEKVLQSRLVATFLTITLPPEPPCSASGFNGSSKGEATTKATASPRPPTPDHMRSSSRERAAGLAQKVVEASTKPTAVRRTSTASTSAKKPPSRPSTPSKLNPATPAVKSGQPSSHVRNTSSLSNGRIPKASTSPKTPTSPSAHRQRPSIPSSLSPSPSLSKSEFPATPPATPPPLASPQISSDDSPPVPDYISLSHRPSTNPTFQMDAHSKGEFAPGTDLSGSKLRVEMWGRVQRGLGWASMREGDAKGKGKETHRAEEDGWEWRVLESWDVDLMDLVPLTDDLAAHPSHLHSNALLITLSPPGQTFYLPPPPSTRPSEPAFPSTQSSGYSSEPESEARKVRTAGDIILPSQPAGPEVEASTKRSALPQLGEKVELGSLKRRGRRVTASWPDLLQLIHVHACIEDTRQSLSTVVQEINQVVTEPASILRREVSEREAWTGQLQSETDVLHSESEDIRERIQARREDLRKRKETLAAARESHESYSQLEFDLEQEMLDERQRLDSLRREIGPLRSDVINTLAFIFPIELVSPPDLLFTVLDVPLPIPIGATDPSPPLSLPSHKEVTEETVATALGYAAQVVHLLAAYTGKHLVYPVTNIGSRSLIKDSISAMVGPRSFPLFTKGVETYRFEYGVYLLNKDIELLMSERNLRALDMRHTLPNLKNLLLTLTGAEAGPRPSQRYSVASSSASLSSLRSPILTASSLPTPDASTNSAMMSSNAGQKPSAPPDGLPTVAVTSPVAESESPPRSGSTTPTRSVADAAAPRKSRAFLDLTPLTGFGFLRGRYASSSRSASGSQDGPSSESGNDGESAQAASDGTDAAVESAAGDDEDDRRTIRGRRDTIVAGGEAKADVNPAGNGHAVPGQNGAAEKTGNGVDRRDTPVLVDGTS
ncbi:UV radiation resistance protein and autophagy-related subunit 14-domain-containing protein [Rhodofomes roseus]|uniref:Autophagy-related protein 14 n=1 Tax=Rhodofomes roseus TaxID=34475 RepID=A0ABQ8KGC0_9APHY|nr:UV radiation resistance protein and autophagy-related subunit 14-domain-containing protein [Rhodofomes roseus]KAH9836605.1 UV radiation resistance protein and autophagy-related subunit 14-domain-containing protein [Rhodofomes roseus]